MTYKITSQKDEKDTKITVVEFEYDKATYSIEISHFRPKDIQDIELGIINRINSEIQCIEACKTTQSINIDLNVEQHTQVLDNKNNNISSEYSTYSIEELNQKLLLLSEEYNNIQNKISQNQMDLNNNSNEYDNIIAELLTRTN